MKRRLAGLLGAVVFVAPFIWWRGWFAVKALVITSAAIVWFVLLVGLLAHVIGEETSHD